MSDEREAQSVSEWKRWWKAEDSDLETKKLANVYAVLGETYMHYCPPYHHEALKTNNFFFPGWQSPYRHTALVLQILDPQWYTQ